MTWRDQAACKSADPKLFDSTTPSIHRLAMDSCRICPVVAECTREAEQISSNTPPSHVTPAGTWGGALWVKGIPRIVVPEHAPEVLDDVSCQTCGAIPGKPCKSPIDGGKIGGYHAGRPSVCAECHGPRAKAATYCEKCGTERRQAQQRYQQRKERQRAKIEAEYLAVQSTTRLATEDVA